MGGGRRGIRRLVEEEFAVSEDQSKRVGFILSSDHWLGGRNYLRNLFSAISTLAGNPIVPVIFTGKREKDPAADFPGIEVIRTSVLDRRSPAWFARKIVSKSSGRDLVLQRTLQRYGVSILSHSFHLGRQTAVKTIGWIPDFQHVYLPEFFSPEQRVQRDLEFMELCRHCDKVIVSSECAREDLRGFAPEYAYKAELLRFVASPIPRSHAVSLPELERLYSFSGPYFLLPNQFWAHKNHRVVVRALQLLKSRREPLLVLATGSSKDYRNPSFFPDLMRYVSECDVQDCFRVLGQIPFDHLVGLMQNATAFINPSRFEGWSTSVEEAKSMGKQIVLSDLRVHREQAPPRGFFFPPEDPEALAAAMKASCKEYNRQEDDAMRDEAKERFAERQREFGEVYLRIIT